MSITSEDTFELAIIESLVEKGDYEFDDQSNKYDPEKGFFKNDVIEFLKTTQPKKWEKITKIHESQTERRVLERLYKELDLRGSLDVLRYGFTDYGVKFQLSYFKPASTLNPDAAKLYEQNKLKVYRQVYFSRRDNKSIDLVITLNGIPLATLELKNQFTSQNVQDAQKQYNTSRDHRELLFAFKKGALVHFSVDQDEVFMTTKIDGDKTRWLPFNKGYKEGKGNPPNPDGYKTSYLWEEILQKDSIMEIVERFLHLEIEKFTKDDKVYKKEKMIFPRYHQLDVVRKITKDVFNEGAGNNYLVQHSAGSGKSNSIAWLSYRMSSIHDENNERIFDSIIVVTDRKVLDSQLQDTIYQFDHKAGVVKKIEKDSNELGTALSYGSNIIITTLQKFPYILDKANDLPDRNYAVIIDEAHSSQGGESSMKMKQVLSGDSEKDIKIINDEEDDDFTNEDYIRENIRQSAIYRAPKSNISFFAFTATPKYKTLEFFGRKNKEGKSREFHLYSMRQAIEEGFILDVLKNYTTYDLYFRLNKAIEDDPTVSKKQANRAVGSYINQHPYHISEKTKIIVEHFRSSVSKKIGGKAKAMVVTGSRMQAKKYYDAFNKYIKEMGYQNSIKILVAFSGTLVDDDYPKGVSESQLTGYKDKEIPKKFGEDDYKILIVADKYQTGFDQPLLHTMYVDKKLSGVKAVQTLSRLNRKHPGKEDTFVLDFANDRKTIYESFQPYYEATTVTDETDFNHLTDLKNKLDSARIYLQSEIDKFADIYFDSSKNLEHKREQKKLYAYTDPAMDRYRDMEDEDKKEEFKKGLRTWTNLYSFLAQVIPVIDITFEKFYAYARYLLKRLPKRELSETLQLDDELALEYFRLEKIKEEDIHLQPGQEGELEGTTEAGLTKPKEERAYLSEIIELFNDRFGTEFEEADRLFLEQAQRDLVNNEKLQEQARANKEDTFKYAFEDFLNNTLIDRMDQNQDMVDKIIGDPEFGRMVTNLMMKSVYERINKYL